jgi:predicted nucleic acid-binding protein
VTFLLDVNVLIALIDPTHVGHDAAHNWFGETGASSWATCPLTENGVIRVNVDQIMTPGQVTDAYLLALAVANKGQLATFDRRLSTKPVHGGRAALHVITGGN